MIVVGKSAYNQLMDIISQYCDYKMPQEYGRSAFWLWIDKIHNEVNQLSVKQSKKVNSCEYVYQMQYWGKIFFTARMIRIRGKFAGTIITITEFQFDEHNFFKWLKHEEPIKYKPKLPNIINPQFKPRQIGFGFTMVKAKSGLFTVADSKGQPLDDREWFKNILNIRKTANGEISTLVNIKGFAYAYYPQREHHLEPTNMSWGRVSANESRKNRIVLTELDLRVMIQECLREVLRVYKKSVVDNKGGKWPDNMSDQDIEIQNDFIRRNRITDSSALPTAWLSCLKHELY